MVKSKKRSRTDDAPSSAAGILLRGGAAEKPRTIAKYRERRHTDVEIHAADGTPLRHGLPRPRALPDGGI